MKTRIAVYILRNCLQNVYFVSALFATLSSASVCLSAFVCLLEDYFIVQIISKVIGLITV